VASDPLPPQLHADRLHDLVDAYVQLALEGGDVAALGPLRLLRARVDVLLEEHASAAHHGDGVPWWAVGEVLGVTPQAPSARDRRRRRARRQRSAGDTEDVALPGPVEAL
jgi:hypothetical protein